MNRLCVMQLLLQQQILSSAVVEVDRRKNKTHDVAET